MDIKILKESVPIDDRTVKLVATSRSDYLRKDYGRSWSSQEGKVELQSTIDRGNLR